MKSLFLLSAALFAISFSSVASNSPVSHPTLKASEVYVPIGNTGKMISLMDLSKISVKDFQEYTGKKMSWGNRLMFKAAQKQLRKDINPDGTMNSKRMARLLSKGSDVTSGFHLGGFILGLLLSLIGVLIAYLINDDLKPSRVKWAWIGAAINLVLWILFAAL